MQKIIKWILVFQFLIPTSLLAQAEIPQKSVDSFTRAQMDISELFLRWRYAGRSMGYFGSQVEPGELANLKNRLFQMKGELKSSLPLAAPDVSFNYQNYIMLYSQFLFVVAAMDPGHLLEWNQELSFSVENQELDFIANIQSENLTEKMNTFLLQEESLGLRVSHNPAYLNEIKKDNELFRPGLSSEGLLFETVRRWILKGLQESAESTEALLNDGVIPQDPRALEKQFRAKAVEALMNNESWQKASELTVIDTAFISRVVGQIFPDREFEKEGLESLLTYIMAAIEKVYLPIAVRRMQVTNIELRDQSGAVLNQFYCQKLRESQREALEMALQQVAEIAERLPEIQSLLSEPFTKPMACDFLTEAQWETLRQVKHPSGFEVRKSWLDQLTKLQGIQKDAALFGEEPVDISSAMKAFRFILSQSELKPSSAMQDWLSSLGSMTDYASLKAAYDQNPLKNRPPDVPNRSLLLTKLVISQKNDIGVLEMLAQTFRFYEEGRTALTYKDLQLRSPDQMDVMREFWFTEKKRSVGLLALTLEDEAAQKIWSEGGDLNAALKTLLEDILNSNVILQNQVRATTKLDELENILDSSQRLQWILARSDQAQGAWAQLSDNQQERSENDGTLKKVYNKYVGVGFAGLLLLQGSKFLLKFKYPRIAAYFAEALNGIRPQAMNTFLISAMALIGIDLAYETRQIFFIESDKTKQIRDLYRSQSIDPSSGLIDYLEWEGAELNLSHRKSEYYFRATLDGLMLGLPAILAIPPVGRGAMQVYQKIQGWRKSRLEKKMAGLLSQIGLSDASFKSMEFVDDVYRAQKKENEHLLVRGQSRLLKSLGPYLKQLPTDKDYINPEAFRRALRRYPRGEEKEALQKLWSGYSQVYLQRGKMEKAHLNIGRFKEKTAKLWQRYAQEYHLEFSQLGMSQPQWRIELIEDAYAASRVRHEAGEMTAKEWERAEEAYQRLMGFLLQRTYELKGSPALKALFFESVLGGRPLSEVLAESAKLTKNGDMFMYEVITLESRDGKNVELLVPKIESEKAL